MQAKTRIDIVVLIAAVAALFFSLPASAQEYDEAPAGYEYVDSLIYVPVASVDSTMLDRDVFDLDIRQSESVRQSMRNHISTNPSRTIAGYRVRIFFDNKQNARAESETTLDKFVKMFRDVPAYRTYTNPYFKVTVGDCRTKSEAMALLTRIRKAFPSAFVVKENISYPAVDKDRVYDVDTVRILRPIAVPVEE